MRLAIGLSEQCYVGEHLGASIVAVIVLVLFGIGFPLGCAYTLYHAFKDGKLPSARRVDTYGFLFRGVRFAVVCGYCMMLPAAVISRTTSDAVLCVLLL